MSKAPSRPDAAVTRVGEPVSTEGAPSPQPSLPTRPPLNLPRALDREWVIISPLPAFGAEAELFVVRRIGGSEQAVVKLYRPGIRPRSEALERLVQMASDHIVRMLGRGESDGIAYELMEYCKFGSLRNLIEDRAADSKWLRRVLPQLVDALAAIHAEGVIHRDLKPENVLIRSLDPLQLALTDFGISPIAAGHHQFTARSLRYSPPETMSGILTLKADYWSLGMILLEMYTGRNPFAGLSEAIINHQLITRPVELSGVRDPAWQTLLRGLLMRNPERRWGAPEIKGWIDGIPSADPAEGVLDDGIFIASVRPYHVGDVHCGTVAELAAALVAHWDVGARDLARGLVTAWLRDELHDHNLVRYAMDLMDDPSLTPDLRLLRFALRAAPQLPAVWRGVNLTDDALGAATRAALNGSPAEREFLASLYEQDALLMFPKGHPDGPRLLAIRERWRRRADICQQAQLRLSTDEQEARREAGAAAGFANFDELMYGRSDLGRSTDPLPHAVLLAPEFAPDEIARVRQRVATAMLGACSWFRGAAEPERLPVEDLAALDAAAPRARRFAEEARARQARLDQAASKEAAALRAEVDAMLHTARAFASQSASALHLRAGLQGVYETYQRLFAKAHAESAGHAHFDPIRRALGRVGPRFLHIMEGIDRLDYLGRLRRLVFRDGWPIALAMMVLPFVARLPTLLGVEVVACVGALGWYGYERASALFRIKHYAGRLPERVEDDEGSAGGPLSKQGSKDAAGEPEKPPATNVPASALRATEPSRLLAGD